MGMYILCPYYKRDRRRSITCEDTIRNYPTLSDKSKVLKKHCASDWKSCKYATAMERIYSQDFTENKLKEKIMENTIEQQKAEINKLMRENGQLTKKLEVLKAQIEDRDVVAGKNHDTYLKSLRNKQRLLEDKDKQIKWLESFAAAFLAVAFGDNVRELKLPRDKIMKLMTGYTMEYRFDDKEDVWIISYQRAEGKANADGGWSNETEEEGFDVDTD